MKFNPVPLARMFVFVREAGSDSGTNHNTGLRVEAIQHWCGGQPGESWCAYFVTMMLDIAFQGSSPIPRTGSCEDIYALAKKNNWLTTVPVEGDLVLYVDDNDHAHHVGFFTNPNCILAGNTSADGTSSDGDGVHEHMLSNNSQYHKFVRYPK